MLKTVLPNVGQESGDLILVDGDTEADTYSPTLRNYVLRKFLIDMEDLADSCIVIEADGKCHLDEDRASGDTLDIDTDRTYFIADPIVTAITEDYNYFEIYGAINPDTGQRFYKLTDNSGTDTAHKFRIVKPTLLTQTDVDNYTAALAGKYIDIKQIMIQTQGLSVHDMGTVLPFKFVGAGYTITQADYYIISETYDYPVITAITTISEGIAEASDYALKYERATEETNSFASEIYDTDKVYFELHLLYMEGTSVSHAIGIQLLTDETVYAYFWIGSEIDPSRNMTITIGFTNASNGALTFDGYFTLLKYDADGSATSTTIESNLNFDTIFTANFGHTIETYTLDSSDIEGNTYYRVDWTNKEAAKTCYVSFIQVSYYIKRSL